MFFGLGETMAEHTQMDYREHDKTYAMFVGMTKWGTIAVVIILVLMALFLL